MTTPPLDLKTPFSDAGAIASYADRTRRIVPGWDDLQKMVTLLVAERAPADGRVLVVGAGGGAELDAMARAQAGWRFVGVDPSAPMLEMARAMLGERAARVAFHEGYVASADAGPFDAATCLLTMHFVPRDERLPTLREIRRRLKPGAPFVLAHMSFPQAPDDEEALLAQAGFSGTRLFYAGLAFRGWIALA